MTTAIKESNKLRTEIIKEAKRLGADLIGFAPVERWQEFRETEDQFFPQNIWPWTKTAIVLGVEIFLPMLETTPSIVYSELYSTTNRLLDEASYRLAAYLNRLGHKAFFFPRDGYGDISVLVEKPEAAFSHVLAGKYAGLGTIGYNHTLLTKEFGPRVRLVTVLTDADFPGDALLEKELCLKCEVCKKCCPTSAFTTRETIIADMDKKKCAEYHVALKNSYRYPCGVCIKVCPVGKDRQLYGQKAQVYLKEEKELLKNPEDISKEYAGWVHCRQFGSKPLDKK